MDELLLLIDTNVSVVVSVSFVASVLHQCSSYIMPWHAAALIYMLNAFPPSKYFTDETVITHLLAVADWANCGMPKQSYLRNQLWYWEITCETFSSCSNTLSSVSTNMSCSLPLCRTLLIIFYYVLLTGELCHELYLALYFLSSAYPVYSQGERVPL